MLTNKNLNKILLTGILTGIALNSAAADSQTTPQTNSASESEPTGDVMTVYSPKVEKEAGTKTTITASDMQKEGGNDFGTIMRYQPLISATGAAGGSGTGKSGFDRGGYTGYNVRGMEANRVSVDVDGVELPTATDRSLASDTGRANLGTYGIGRDYIDPYMYGSVGIESGATSVTNSNNALGGSVSFRPKSADDYLSADKTSYFGYQSDYDSSNRSWHNGITAAAGDDYLRGVIVVSRRDGQETENNSGTIDAYPANWHSNAILASGIWQATDTHQLTATLDYYHKTNHTHYDTWNSSGSSIIGTAQQSSQTRRWGASLADRWTPENNSFFDVVDSKIFYQKTQAHDNTYMPDAYSSGYPMQLVYSDYDTDTFGVESRASKEWNNHRFSFGLNARQANTKRPFTQEGSVGNQISRPQADSSQLTLGAFAQDTITWDLGGHDFSIVPGVRAAYQKSKPENLSNLLDASSVADSDEVNSMYSSNSDTQILPSLSFLYDIKPDLIAYIQYKRGAQFPNAGQLYGAWNVGTTTAYRRYAIVSSPDLETETSNNYELGLKGQVVEGITLSAATFYNDYKNFIAYTRYTRTGNPEKFTNVPSQFTTIYQAENRDKAYIYGGEISAKFNLGTWFEQANGFSTRLAFGYAEGASKSSYSGDKYVDLESVAPMKAIVGIAYDDPSKLYGAALTATFNKGKQATSTDTRNSYNNSGSDLTESTTEYMRVPGYGVVDLTAYYRVAKNVKLSGGIYNITDRKYWDYLSSRNLENSTNQDLNDQQLAVAPGRTFQLGVNVDF
ncbi:TonB-dependent receptor [Brenneria roseae subsp. americana]|uniref:TonB-dependent receptor n=1 Tax=Brenneria roseae subsp. americana TaxID=1508507 RepID=A0A2U1TUR1_9GAMM|nr:TonB-dependent receptor [Brenneria roseae]PWC13141.1 TonB-dependent receptor [Brenneria roseae subsp. americana]